MTTVSRQYDGFGNLLSEQQRGKSILVDAQGVRQFGPVYDDEVIYNYTHSAEGNYIRLNTIAYPSVYQLQYNYDGDLNAAINRVSGVSEFKNNAWTFVEAYQYLGLGTIVTKNRPGNQPGMSLTLDAFGRVDRITWGDPSDPDDGYDYGYDRARNLLHRENLAKAEFSSPRANRT